MAYRIEPDETVEAGLRRIAVEQLERASAALEDEEAPVTERIHDVRKRAKKVRALLRLVRDAFPGYKAANARLRDLARAVSGPRDAGAAVECLDALVRRHDEALAADDEALTALRTALVARRVAAEQELDDRLEATAAELRALRAEAAGWTLEEQGFAALAGGLERTYARGRAAHEAVRAHRTSERSHEWRKRAKYHRLHFHLLRDVWPDAYRARRDRAARLADLLGDEHDLFVLTAALADLRVEHARAVTALLPLAEARRDELSAFALADGQALYAEKPGALRKRVRGAWRGWRTRLRLESALPAEAAQAT